MTRTAPKPDARPRNNLRLELKVWRSIDSARKKRPGNVSRNTWITEAILEKLARDTANDQGNGGTHA